MQTLVDPFELAPHVPVAAKRPAIPVAVGPRRDVAVSLAEIDVQLEEDAVEDTEPPRSSRSPDSSGRLRCWCSED